MHDFITKYRMVSFFLALLINASPSWADNADKTSKPIKAESKNASLIGDNTKQKEKKMITTPSGLGIEILTDSDGAMPVKGNTIKAHYTGWLLDGTKFDSSRDRGQPLEFKVGVGQVIKGWDEGLLAMKVGQKVKLHIPAELGYGSRGAGAIIKPNSDLVFEVELVEIVK